MIEPLLDLPSHQRQRLAAALDSGLLGPPYAAASLRATVGLEDGIEAIATGLRDLDRIGVSGRGAAAWLRTVEAVTAKQIRPDLVWSGPEVPGLHVRRTRDAFDQLLAGATRSLWISTYAYFDGPRAFQLLARRMDACPGLRVTLLLNIQRKRGDPAPADQLVRSFADRLWKEDWPGQARPTVFYDPRALDPERPSGVLHAKAVVADDEAVFVTSANLTEAAFDRNIEVGVLVRDRPLALSMASHFRVLVEQRMLRLLPSD